MDMFLTQDEIVNLTRRKHVKKQISALESMGIDFIKRPDGTPAVLRTYIERRAGIIDDKKRAPKKVTPRWEFVNA